MRWRAKIPGKASQYFSTFECVNKDTQSNYHMCLCLSSQADKGGGMTSSERGSVLVFLPGLHEISYMQEALAKLVHKRF